MNIERFYLLTQGIDPPAYSGAIRFACSLAQRDTRIKRITLLTPSKNTGYFNQVFSSAEVNDLNKGKGTTLVDCTPRITTQSIKSYSATATPSEVVITFGLDSTQVLEQEYSSSIIAIIGIDDVHNHLHKWVQTWNPTDIQTGRSVLTIPVEPSCPVRKALDHLSVIVNTAERVFGSTDEESTKTCMRALHHGEKSRIDPVAVFAYLRRAKHWQVQAAGFAEQLILKLNESQTFKGGKRTGMAERYQQWEKECS